MQMEHAGGKSVAVSCLIHSGPGQSSERRLRSNPPLLIPPSLHPPLLLLPPPPRYLNSAGPPRCLRLTEQQLQSSVPSCVPRPLIWYKLCMEIVCVCVSVCYFWKRSCKKAQMAFFGDGAKSRYGEYKYSLFSVTCKYLLNVTGLNG